MIIAAISIVTLILGWTCGDIISPKISEWLDERWIRKILKEDKEKAEGKES